MKYILKTIQRAPIRSGLFFLLILIGSAIGCIGLNIRSVSLKNEKKSQEAFHIMARLDGSEDDETFAQEYESMTQLPYVYSYRVLTLSGASNVTYNFKKSTFGVVSRKRIEESKSNRWEGLLYEPMQTVITFCYLGNDQGKVESVLYGNIQYPGKCCGKVFTLCNYSSNIESMEVGDHYLAYGELCIPEEGIAFMNPLYYEGENYSDFSWDNLQFHVYDYQLPYYMPGMEQDEDILPDNLIQSYPGIEMESQKSEFWNQILRDLKLTDHRLCVIGVEDVERIFDFHQRTATVVDGRFFTPQEYETGENACMITIGLAEANELTIGDSISIQLYMGDLDNLGKYMPGVEKYESNVYGRTKVKIIGMYKPQESTLEVRQDRRNIADCDAHVILPKRTMERLVPDEVVQWQSNVFDSYGGLLTVSEIETAHIREFLKEIKNNHAMEVEVFDQGYFIVEKGIQKMKQIGTMVLVITGVCMVFLIGIFIYFEVAKRKSDIKILYGLGCSYKAICKTLFCCIFFILLPATITGSILGATQSKQVVESIQKQSQLKSVGTSQEVFYADHQYEQTMDLQMDQDTMNIGIIIIVNVLFAGAYTLVAFQTIKKHIGVKNI